MVRLEAASLERIRSIWEDIAKMPGVRDTVTALTLSRRRSTVREESGVQRSRGEQRHRLFPLQEPALHHEFHGAGQVLLVGGDPRSAVRAQCSAAACEPWIEASRECPMNSLTAWSWSCPFFAAILNDRSSGGTTASVRGTEAGLSRWRAGLGRLAARTALLTAVPMLPWLSGNEPALSQRPGGFALGTEGGH